MWRVVPRSVQTLHFSVSNLHNVGVQESLWPPLWIFPTSLLIDFEGIAYQFLLRFQFLLCRSWDNSIFRRSKIYSLQYCHFLSRQNVSKWSQKSKKILIALALLRQKLVKQESRVNFIFILVIFFHNDD